LFLAPQRYHHVAGALEARQRDMAIVQLGDYRRSLPAIRG
jgi:hypothetical protein